MRDIGPRYPHEQALVGGGGKRSGRGLLRRCGIMAAMEHGEIPDSELPDSETLRQKLVRLISERDHDFEELRNKKRALKGGFERRVYLIAVREAA